VGKSQEPLEANKLNRFAKILLVPNAGRSQEPLEANKLKRRAIIITIPALRPGPAVTRFGLFKGCFEKSDSMIWNNYSITD
jgi:hypothetical protein